MVSRAKKTSHGTKFESDETLSLSIQRLWTAKGLECILSPTTPHISSSLIFFN